MSRDTLSNLLSAIRLRGAVFYHIEGIPPWIAEAPPAAEIIPAILPGVEHLMEFHAVASGSCWAGLIGDPPRRLESGDLVIFPQGDGHVITSNPDLRGGRVDPTVYYAPRPAQLPFTLRVSKRGAAGRSAGRGVPDATIACGFLGCDVRPFNPLLAALPRMLHVPARPDAGSSWLSGLVRAILQESKMKRPGGEAVLERMTEMMFIEALRRYVDALPREETGWLAGLSDATVGRALALLHERPAEAWTLERLARAAAVSRSTLHERFVHFIGQPPMQYLARWRMQAAARWLRETDAKVLEVALEVGYENETAFARAFRRATGESPGAWRRARRAQPGRGGSRASPTPRGAKKLPTA